MSESGTADSPVTSSQSSPRSIGLFQTAENNNDEIRQNLQLARGDAVVAQEHVHTENNAWRRQGEGDEPDVLEPDHPLMKRFQSALKAHLERQYNRISEEVFELESGIKKKELEREELGVSLYDMQLDVAKQQSLIDKYHESLANVTKLRQEMEAQVETSRQIYKSEQEKLSTAQKKEEELRTELEGLMCLERQFADWEKEMQSELAISERISEKTKIERSQLTEKMQKQDIFILKLLSEIANLEARLVTLDSQFRMKEAEREKLSQSVADANADLEALSKEQHRLVQSWNSVIVSMQQRDKIYSKLMKDYNDVQENFLTLNHEIEAMKKMSDEEMLKNERLTIILNKVQNESANLERLTALEEEKKGTLEIELSTVHNMLEQTDKDMEEVMLVFHKYSHEHKVLQKEVEKLSWEKVVLEDGILEKLQDQITQDKAAKYLNKMLYTLRNKTRSQEISMVNTENQLTQVSLDVECQKGVNEHTRLQMEDMKRETTAQKENLDKLESQLSHCMFELGKKQGELESLNRKLDQLAAKQGTAEQSPQEMKIADLETNIEETTDKIEELQNFWMRQQSHIVQLANQRNEQLQNINLMRKQVQILEQKNLKIEYEMDHQKKEEQTVSRSISALFNKLLSLNLKLCERKDYKDSLDKENMYTQNQYINILKDAEMEAVLLQSEIHDLEQEKIQLRESLLETQREFLAWEKKLQMALETKQNADREKAREGEVGTMKTEIHRMQVRYSQLRKAQEKLIGDLEHCVSRRDAIVDQAEARERKAYKGSHNTRYKFQKKLEEMRNKIKHVNSEIKSVQREIADGQQRQEQLIEQLKDKQQQVQQLQDATKEMSVQLEEGQLQRQKNLEVLVRRQRKARMYNEVKAGRHRLLFRNENSLEAELQRQKTMNADLISALESLLVDFPALKFPLTKILNTLRLKPA